MLLSRSQNPQTSYDMSKEMESKVSEPEAIRWMNILHDK